MLKKCLIFLFILSINCLCPFKSMADPDPTQLGPAKDICVCNCLLHALHYDGALYQDNQCKDQEFEYENISDEKQCKKKNGQDCRGYMANSNEVEPGRIQVTCGPNLSNGRYENCHLVGVPDDGG